MAKPLNEIFFQEEFFEKLSKFLKREYKDFDEKKFLKLIYFEGWDELSLKERLHYVGEVLGKILPEDFEKAVEILKRVEKDFEGFEHLIFAEFVGIYGLDNWQKSMDALEVFTRSTAEFAVRPFILKYPEKTMKQMLKWSKSKDVNIRRLSSEGCRPRAAWTFSLPEFKKDPSPILPILENLKDDPSDYVRKSVANNLNDISKDNPDLILKLAKKWIGKSERTDKLLKHALRTLLKKGNRQALGLFKLEKVDGVSVKNLKINPSKIKIGDSAKFSFDLEVKGKDKKKLRLEYIVDYVKATGKTSEKVFQLKEKAFKPGEYHIEKKIDFKQLTTRKHHPGKHKLTIVVNGERKERGEFELITNL